MPIPTHTLPIPPCIQGLKEKDCFGERCPFYVVVVTGQRAKLRRDSGLNVTHDHVSLGTDCMQLHQFAHNQPLRRGKCL